MNFGKYGCFYLEAIEVSSQDAKSLRIVLGWEILLTNNRGSDPHLELQNTCPHPIGSVTGS